MDLSQFTKYISERNRISVEEAEKLLTSAIESLAVKLSKGEDGVMPGLGNLEVKAMPGRTTVFFKYLSTLQVNKEPRLFLSENEDKKAPASVFEIVAELLLKGETVTLPSVGVFQPLINEAGECVRVSFIVSPALRSVLNGQPEKETRKVPEFVPRTEFVPRDIPQKEDTESTGTVDDLEETEETGETEEQPLPQKPERMPKHPVRRTYEVEKDDDIEPNEFVLSQKKNKMRRAWLLLLLCVIVVVALVVFLIKFQPEQQQSHLVEPVRHTTAGNSYRDLLDLAKEHYGHAAYWVYIYDANSNKISSPFDSVQDSLMIFPDLKASYNVDINDTLEIVRANMVAESILKKYKKKEY